MCEVTQHKFMALVQLLFWQWKALYCVEMFLINDSHWLSCEKRKVTFHILKYISNENNNFKVFQVYFDLVVNFFKTVRIILCVCSFNIPSGDTSGTNSMFTKLWPCISFYFYLLKLLSLSHDAMLPC